MTGYRDMSIGAGKFFGGLQQMGVTDEVHIARFCTLLATNAIII